MPIGGRTRITGACGVLLRRCARGLQVGRFVVPVCRALSSLLPSPSPIFPQSQGAARAGDDNGLAAHSINVREVELEPAPRELCWQRCKVSRGFFRARSEHLLVVRRRYGTEHVQRSATEYYRMLHDCLALRQANVQRLIYVDMAMVPSAMVGWWARGWWAGILIASSHVRAGSQDHFYHFYEDVETTLSARIAVCIT